MSIIIKSIVDEYKVIDGNNDLSSKLAGVLGIEQVFADLLSKYECVNLDNAADFINPKLKNLFPNPCSLMNMNMASSVLIKAIKENKKIGILGDYDVDGVCSSAIIKIFLQWLGVNPEIVIPDRFKDGYGPSIPLFKRLAESGVELILTLDCGTVAFEPIEYAKSIGIEVIVVDHHISQEKKPDAIAIINPNQIGDASGLGHLCAAGVTFLLCTQVLKDMKQQELDTYDINIMNLSHFVAIATVCDMMKMIGVNRAFYKTGVEILNFGLDNFSKLDEKTKIAFNGIKGLCEAVNLRRVSSSSDIGFKIGPALNAPGRLKSAMTALNLLTCDNEGVAYNLAYEIVSINSERKDVQEEVLQDALERVNNVKDKNLIFIASQDYNEGIIGIVASRIKDLYHKSVIIGSIRDSKEGGIIKVSCRACNYVDIGGIVIKALEAGLILKGGGHKAAAGFSCKYEKFQEVYDFFENEAKIQRANCNGNDIIDVHAVLDIWSFEDVYKDVCQFEPFGILFQRPNFIIRGADVVEAKQMSAKYSKVLLRSKDQKNGKYKYLDCVYFGQSLNLQMIKSSQNLIF